MRLDVDNLHYLKTKQHKDCDWYWEENMECTNWKEFKDPLDYAILECYKEKEVLEK